ncbi:hypothetical protein LTR50_002155 [Elasticomyces elasticus]|nr:hypothetical protein LTR50_002155 [Elasticomyces elasticus]
MCLRILVVGLLVLTANAAPINPTMISAAPGLMHTDSPVSFPKIPGGFGGHGPVIVPPKTLPLQELPQAPRNVHTPTATPAAAAASTATEQMHHVINDAIASQAFDTTSPNNTVPTITVTVPNVEMDNLAATEQMHHVINDAIASQALDTTSPNNTIPTITVTVPNVEMDNLVATETDKDYQDHHLDNDLATSTPPKDPDAMPEHVSGALVGRQVPPAPPPHKEPFAWICFVVCHAGYKPSLNDCIKECLDNMNPPNLSIPGMS